MAESNEKIQTPPKFFKFDDLSSIIRSCGGQTGPVVQRLECLAGSQEITGSNPVGSTESNSVLLELDEVIEFDSTP